MTDEPGNYIKDVEHRYVTKHSEGAFGSVIVQSTLQTRKLMRQGPGNNWNWVWTDWVDVPSVRIA